MRNTRETQENVLAIGDFVLVRHQNLGIGKLASLHDDVARVTWFESPAQPIVREHDVPARSARRVELGNQHRVYHRDPHTGIWQAGRIADAGRVSGRHFGLGDDLYFVAFPNGDKRRVSIAQLETRWDRPLIDPTPMLAARTTITPFWHEGRVRLMRSAMAQRAACGGLTGLFSASVDLLEHQVRVVRTVLNDPIPRYLLADEVGLGKTIEALAILRQFVLEHPHDHRTIIVSPPHLREQWVDELSWRFRLGPLLDHSIRIIGPSELSSEKAPRLLIVDEAHHPARYAYDSSEEKRELYQKLARLAHQAPCLLLLSATPVLHNEDGFLAMLHLLDPVAYPLQDREAFRLRVSQRQQIADWLGDLQDDASPLFMEDTLNGLSGRLGEDARLLHLVEVARHLIDEDEYNKARKEALASLRAHIGEIYRLHRRILRTRRTSLTEPLWGRASAHVIVSKDSTRTEAEQLLLEWRGDLMLSVYREESLRHTAMSLWRCFLSAAMSHPAALRELAVARLEHRAPLEGLATCPLDVLHAPPVFDGEWDRLRGLADLLENHRSTRDAALLEYLQANPRERFVIFVDRPPIARQIHGFLEEALGDTVRIHRNHADVTAFTQEFVVRVLLCDASAEEGLNLNQHPAIIVHYDLPLAPNRVEQRIGRIDRIGSKRKVASLVFDDGSPLTTAWLNILRSPIGVFEDSIASLQYVLDEHIRAFVENSFNEGLEAFGMLEDALRDEEKGLAAELVRVRRQEALDTLEADASEHLRFEEMEDFDLEDDQLQEEMESWLVGRLMVGRESTDERGWRCRYVYRPHGSKSTLIPLEHWQRWFGGRVIGSGNAASMFPATPELTYRRRQAHLHLLPLVRVGHPLFDGSVAYAERDDRGAAFSMWRFRPSHLGERSSLAFRFDFRIDTDPGYVIGKTQSAGEWSSHAVQRRLDALFSPRFLTIWLDEELEPIEDSRLLELLEQPYAGDPMVGGGQDWNLVGEKWDIVDSIHPVADWSALVEKAALMARRRVYEDPSLKDVSLGARKELSMIATTAMAQLAARLQRLEGAALEFERAHLEQERMLFEAMDVALETPNVRLDSVGAIFLARHSPFNRNRA